MEDHSAGQHIVAKKKQKKSIVRVVWGFFFVSQIHLLQINFGTVPKDEIEPKRCIPIIFFSKLFNVLHRLVVPDNWTNILHMKVVCLVLSMCDFCFISNLI